jgi:hypothetical protein
VAVAAGRDGREEEDDVGKEVGFQASGCCGLLLG